MVEHIVPLRKGFVKAPRHKRAQRALTVLKTFLARHLKADEIKIGQHLNEYIWSQGIRNPPGKVAISTEYVTVDGKKVAHVELQGKKFSESVRPEELVEQASGLKGKLQAMTQGKKGDEPKDKAEEKVAEKTKATTAKATKAPQEASKAPVAAKKTPTKPVEKAQPPKKTTKTE